MTTRAGCGPGALALLVSGSCSSDEAVSGFPAPAGPATVALRATECLAHPPAIRAGRVVVRARNTGRLGHDVILVRLPDDLAVPLAEQVRSATRLPVETVAALALAPGDRGSFAVDLAPGRYGFVCFVPGPDGETHARKGMASDLRVMAAANGVRSEPGAGGSGR